MLSVRKVLPYVNSESLNLSMERLNIDNHPNTPSESVEYDISAVHKDVIYPSASIKKDPSPISYIDYAQGDPYKQSGIRPRFLSDGLELEFAGRLELTKAEPIQVSEAALYRITKHYQSHFEGAELTIEHLASIHHIYKLQQIEHELSPEEVSIFNQNLQEVLCRDPNIQLEHKLFLDIAALVSSLSVKWGIVKFERYSYRYTSRVANVKLLDMSILNEDVYTVEALWLAVMITHAPLKDIVDHDVIQYGKVLRRAMDDVIRAIVQLNSEANYERTPSLEAVYAVKYPKIAAVQNWEADATAQEPTEYHTLSQAKGVMAKCFGGRHQRVNKQLRTMIANFDHCYRIFERELITFFLMVDEPND
jgi:hypothetical protein